MDREQDSPAEATQGNNRSLVRRFAPRLAGGAALTGGIASTVYLAASGLDPVAVTMGGGSAILTAGLAAGHLLKRISVHTLVRSVAGSVSQAEDDGARLRLVREAVSLAAKLDRRT